MPIASIEAYLNRLPARMDELKLAMADAASVPHMKDSDRKDMLKSWMRGIEMFTATVVRPASRARLKLMGIGVRTPAPAPNGAGMGDAALRAARPSPPVSVADIPPNTEERRYLGEEKQGEE